MLRGASGQRPWVACSVDVRLAQAVVFMPEGSKTHKGGTMRLGARKTTLETVECITARLYQSENYLDERHRHRYEVCCNGLRLAEIDQLQNRRESGMPKVHFTCCGCR